MKKDLIIRKVILYILFGSLIGIPGYIIKKDMFVIYNVLFCFGICFFMDLFITFKIVPLVNEKDN